MTGDKMTPGVLLSPELTDTQREQLLLDHHPERPRSLPWRILAVVGKILSVLLFFAGPFFAGYGISQLLFHATQWRPTPVVAYLIEFLISFAVLAFLFWAVAFNASRRLMRRNSHFGEDILQALERIAQGDFSVVLPAPHDSHAPLAELAESVNKMAHDLGDIDQQRRDFVSNVSHEIQSPLTSIGGFAALLHDPTLDPATRDHYLDIIVAESKRLSQLSDNLLKLSALQDNEAALVREQVVLNEQLAVVISALEPQLQAKSQKLRVALTPVLLEGDRELLDLVWINLIQNACKYTPAGGEVTVKLATAGDRAIVTVSDTGIGMSPPELLHVFERFYRADKSRSRSEGDSGRDDKGLADKMGTVPILSGGNGLGLALVKEIVEAHGGQVNATSQTGVGSTFTVELPLMRRNPVAPAGEGAAFE